MSEDQLSRVFAALADPTRRDIVARLSVGDATVGHLAAPYDVSIQAVSKHLKVLEDAGLVSRSQDAQRRPRHLEAEVFDLMTAWIERKRGHGSIGQFLHHISPWIDVGTHERGVKSAGEASGMAQHNVRLPVGNPDQDPACCLILCHRLTPVLRSDPSAASAGEPGA